MLILNCFEANIKSFIASHEFSTDGRPYLIIFEVAVNQSCNCSEAMLIVRRKKQIFFYHVYHSATTDCSRRRHGQIVNFK